jgi:hypothetical protein
MKWLAPTLLASILAAIAYCLSAQIILVPFATVLILMLLARSYWSHSQPYDRAKVVRVEDVSIPQLLKQFDPNVDAYAMMSSAVYRDDDYAQANEKQLKEDGWTLVEEAPQRSLYWHIWSKEKLAVVVFRGTRFKNPSDWCANLRWILRWLPPPDHFGQLLADKDWKDRLSRFDRVVAVGHSLGGGLAQCFLYGVDCGEFENRSKCKEVVSFNGSPVTAYRSVNQAIRDRNTEGARVLRIHEHREALAFIRGLLREFYPQGGSNPQITEVSCATAQGLTAIGRHGIDRLASAFRGVRRE